MPITYKDINRKTSLKCKLSWKEVYTDEFHSDAGNLILVINKIEDEVKFEAYIKTRDELCAYSIISSSTTVSSIELAEERIFGLLVILANDIIPALKKFKGE